MAAGPPQRAEVKVARLEVKRVQLTAQLASPAAPQAAAANRLAVVGVRTKPPPTWRRR